MANQTCLCIDAKTSGCKAINRKGPVYMKVQTSEVQLEYPKTCFKARSQCFCQFGACALPCEGSNSPSAVSFLCLTLYPNVGCAKKLSEIPHKSLTGGAPPAPETLTGGAPPAPDAASMDRPRELRE